MKQMFGFRGAASSPATPGATGDPRNPSRTPLPPPSSAAGNGVGGGAVAFGPARPLRLVYCDEGGKFRMDPEAVAALQLVKGPIGVVSVCGRARQGKSFILNQGTYSTQIFSLAVLLSSMFIYNQMGGIDEAALDRLSLVTEMTKHIRVRASGGRSTASELGQFSPVFVWLLRDFYLDLAEDNRKITPRDYLELALRPTQGGGKDMHAKNEIRESIRALFPDRECFTLVRPVNKESDLQRLDQIHMDRLRPEFRAGLDDLTKFVFERTRPKQVGATMMTGPLLAGLTQSFLDAINKGAVPTISSSWQSVEEAECRRAYDFAVEVYTSSFDRTKPAEEDALREAHEDAVGKALAAFNSCAVGAGSVRLNYEKLLHSYFKKAFEDYKRSAFLEADLQCSNTIRSMETKLRAACHGPDVKIDNVMQLLDSLLSEYESSSHGAGKWKILAVFLRQCLAGPILDLFKRQLNRIETEISTLRLKCTSSDDKLELLKKQLEANERQRSEYVKRYEEAVSDKQRISKDYAGRITDLQSKSSKLEERCMSLSNALDLAKRESAEWKSKYDQSASEQKADEEKLRSQLASLESKINVSEGRLAAVREQAESAQEEASEWKRKYEVAVGEAKNALQRAALAQERTNKKVQEREDALRAELANQLSEKDEEITKLIAQINQSEKHVTSLIARLEATESKMKNHETESSRLKEEMGILTENLNSIKAEAQGHEKQVRILEQEKNHLEDKYLSECKKFDEIDKRCKDAEREAKRATELADAARADAASAQKEKAEAQRLAMERLTLIERSERQVETLEREKAKLTDEIERLRQSEMDSVSKVNLLERRVDEREREIEEMLSRNNEQRSNTVQVLESLLATERAACAEANRRAETLSLQLQSTQGKLDMLQQELTSVRLNETALDSKLKTVHKRHEESVHDMDIDEEVGRRRKRSKSTTSPFKYSHMEDGGSVFRGEENNNNESQEIQETETEDYTKFTVLKLKQELTKKGFGGQLLQLKNPNKKDIIALYEKHVIGK
ncbi:Guanylate-binding protein 1 [Ananas comosus]|uniref:Guanylate-binding protein 1 n=1 Tax=Ananas comosus TaxID=4615 RepID=A0A199UPQ8_ANACO|nr:Guanylate-binding protein 1 [Ananas comosus]